MIRRGVAAASAISAAAFAAPERASAHGLVGRQDLPIPTWLFTWGATGVLVVSFVALAAAWPVPKLQRPHGRPLPARVEALASSRVVEVVCGVIGILLFAFTIYAGLAGAQSVAANWTPTFVYVGFWLGLVPLSLLFGDIFRAFNPWLAIGRTVGWIVARVSRSVPEPLTYPQRLGYWPAAAGLLAFGWLEVISAGGDDPSTIAVAALVYSSFTFVGMSLYGVDAWSQRGEAFGVYFGLFARMSVIGRCDGRLALRAPLSGLTGWEPRDGGVALLAVMIGVVSFDGLSGGRPYNDSITDVIDGLRDIGLGPSLALETAYAVSMLLVIGLSAGLFLFGMRGAHSIDRRFSTRLLASKFAHTLVPIALAYVLAHYVSLLLLQGQALWFLASDPLGRGDNLFGTADRSIDYTFIGAETFWYLQVGFVVAGHVAGLVLSHDRALALYEDAKSAVRSQYWLLGVMVGFTTLALWLLAQAREG